MLLAHHCSGRFPFDYAENHQEHVLVIDGKATLTPNDGSKPVAIAAGDHVIFHRGFACEWQVLEPMRKHYCYFDEDGNETVSNTIECDLCQGDCSALSYLMDGEVDLCASCFASNGHKYKACEKCVDGKEIGVVAIPKKPVKKGGGAAKKIITKKPLTKKK